MQHGCGLTVAADRRGSHWVTSLKTTIKKKLVSPCNIHVKGMYLAVS